MSLEDSDADDRVYNEFDYFDEGEYQALLEALTPARKPIVPRGNGLRLFQSLGVNVIGLLLTYFSVGDFLRVTGVCRWLYRLGSDTRTLQGIAGAHGQASSRAEFVERYRTAALRSKKHELGKAAVFLREYVNVIHVCTVGSRPLFFSLFECRLIVWQYRDDSPQLISRFLALPSVEVHSIDGEGAALLNRTSLCYINSKWLSTGYDNRWVCTHEFPSESVCDSVNLVPGHQFIVVGREGSIRVMTRRLEEICRFECGTEELRYGKLICPQTERPMAVLVGPRGYSVYHIRSGKEIRHSKQPLLSIKQAEILSVPAGAATKQYLLVVGFLHSSCRLFANYVEICDCVNSMHIHGLSILVFTRPFDYQIYVASAERISFQSVLKLSSTVYDLYLSVGRSFACIQKEESKTYGSPTVHQTKLWFMVEKGQGITQDTVSNLELDKAFSSPTEVVLTGLYHPARCQCVVIVYYYRDAEENWLQRIKELQQKSLQLAVSNISEEEQQRAIIATRALRKAAKSLRIRRKQLHKSRHWKSKLRRFAAQQVRSDISSAL